jgi:hypothetical protein
MRLIQIDPEGKREKAGYFAFFGKSLRATEIR